MTLAMARLGGLRLPLRPPSGLGARGRVLSAEDPTVPVAASAAPLADVDGRGLQVGRFNQGSVMSIGEHRNQAGGMGGW